MSRNLSPKQALQAWAQVKEIAPTDLAIQTGMSYQHAWNIMRGEYPITYETLGKLLVVFGVEGPAPAIAEAMRAEQTNGNGNRK